jgi:hypothetical protein
MEKLPNGGCQLGNRGSDPKTWAFYTGAHGQEPMNSFEPRSMMQEHPYLIKRASAWRKKYSWIAPAHTFLKYFRKLVRCHLNEGIHNRAHLYIVMDLEQISSHP